MSRLDGRVAIITGGAGGMGSLHAQEFVREGAKVVITDLNEAAGNDLVQEIGGNSRFIKHDVTEFEEWQKVVKETEEVFGPVNILVNNAGIGVMNSIEEMGIDQYKNIIDINQLSVFLGMKAVVSSMRQAENASIINISSHSGIVGALGGIGYSTSKFAVRGMTKVAALEFAADKIRVNSIHPGVVETPMLKDPKNKEIVEEVRETIPFKRFAQPQEVTNLAIFLASDESTYSTGSEFILDGGITAQ